MYTILVCDMWKEFPNEVDRAEDVHAFSHHIQQVLNIEHGNGTKIVHIGSELILPHNGEKEYLTVPEMVKDLEKEELVFLCGVHFGRCIKDYADKLKCPAGILLNLTLLHPQDTWEEKLDNNEHPLYLWSIKEICQI